jgi:Mrp family chromosome partitioning ATPase
MADLLEELREKFDMIIVDCPPLLPVTDAAVVAARADGALLLSRARKTTSAQVTTAVQALQSVDARLLGCVLNMVAAKGPDAYYYYDEYSSRSARGSRHGRRATRGPVPLARLTDLKSCGDPDTTDATTAAPSVPVR